MLSSLLLVASGEGPHALKKMRNAMDLSSHKVRNQKELHLNGFLSIFDCSMISRDTPRRGGCEPVFGIGFDKRFVIIIVVLLLCVY